MPKVFISKINRAKRNDSYGNSKNLANLSSLLWPVLMKDNVSWRNAQKISLIIHALLLSRAYR